MSIAISDFHTEEIKQSNPIALWQFADQRAAKLRLQILLQISNQPFQIDEEFLNFRVSINFLKTQINLNSFNFLCKYIEILEPYLYLRGKSIELIDWCNAGINICERLRKNPAFFLFILGNAQYSLGKWEQANISWDNSFSFSYGYDEIIYARSALALGKLQINQGQYAKALKTLAKAEILLKSINDIEGVISARSEIASYHLNRRELELALRLYHEIDELYKKNFVEESSNHILLMLGVVYRQKRIFHKAIDYFEEICKRSEIQRDLSSLATATHHLAWVYYELKDFTMSHSLCGKALAIYEDINDPRGLSDGYEQLGAIFIEQGKLNDAIIILKKSLRFRQNLGNNPGAISSLRRLTLALLIKGKLRLVLALTFKVLIQYFRLGILSRERILALIRDFFIGIRKTVKHTINKNQVNTSNNTSNIVEHRPKETIAESLSQILILGLGKNKRN